ncbi:MAG: Segregation and condensation protein A [Phycisphaerae bacterium]|nr:Segregation and condensation protein A [Phycisphaerae bacterium]
MTEEYKVQLSIYNGPLDLLLYLIRRQEVDIYDIPIASVTEQYLAYVQLIQQLDPDQAAEFLVMAATLMEIKSRTLLPKPPPESEEEENLDPRLELVRQLLEYKAFKDAAHDLRAAADQQAQRYGRLPSPLRHDESNLELDYVQVWDLVAAFGKVLNQITLTSRQHQVVYDDTPISLHAADILDRLQRLGGSLAFLDIFSGCNRAQVIGLFLATLELIRSKRIRVEQDHTAASILLHLLDATPLAQLEVDNYVTTSSPIPPADSTPDVPEADQDSLP